MKKDIHNLESMKRSNRLAVLNLLRTKDTVSRIDLTHELKCNGTTVTRMMRDLIDNDFVETVGTADSTGGRPKQLIRLNRNCRQAIAISIEPGSILGLLVNLLGDIIVRDQVMLDEEASQPDIVNILTSITGRLLEKSDRKRLLGISVSTAGQYQGGTKKVIGISAHLHALEGLDIEKLFIDRFQIFPEITDGTMAKALNEVWFNGRGKKGTLVLLNIGRGIGSAIMTDGKMSFARNSHPGEFGHTIYDIHGKKCACGRSGCLETIASIPSIQEDLKERLKVGGINFGQIVELYNKGNPDAVNAVDNAAEALGIALANIVNFLIPNEIVLCGKMLELGEKYTRNVIKKVEELAFPAFVEGLTIHCSEGGPESSALGGATLLFQKFFTSQEDHKNF